MRDLPPPAIGARSVQGRLHLRFARAGRRTVLTDSERTPPCHVQRLLYLDRQHPALAQVVLLNTTAGLFAGDRLDLRICLADGAAVALTTPTMSRVFGMRDGHADVTMYASVAAGSYLEYLPAGTILCRGASLRQRTELDAEAGARVALGEVVAFGRAAHGERHAYRELRQRSQLRYAGKPVLSEGLLLTPDTCPDAVGVLGPFAAYGSLQLLAGDDNDALLAKTRSLLAREAQGHVSAAASLLPAGTGVAVRALGDSPHAVQRLLRLVCDDFRRWASPRSHRTPAPQANRGAAAEW